MDDQIDKYAAQISNWARTKREIGEVWLFGSRVRGTHRPKSDLDIAVIMRDPSRPKSDRYGDWVCLADEWERELKALLPIPIDLDLGDQDISTNVVAPALSREGVRVYYATETR